jgi:hypothetical protein
MHLIEYKATWSEGMYEIISVRARDITSGFTKALRIAKKGAPAAFGNLHSIEFWMVRT